MFSWRMYCHTNHFCYGKCGSFTDNYSHSCFYLYRAKHYADRIGCQLLYLECQCGRGQHKYGHCNSCNKYYLYLNRRQRNLYFYSDHLSFRRNIAFININCYANRHL